MSKSSGMIQKTEQEWREQLNELEYEVLRKSGTERPFTGKYTDHFDKGIYLCNACNHPLFESEHKYHSGCGWPAFMGELDTANITRKPDNSWGMKRVELLCSNCGSHLGHVFEDGPPPAFERYCINSVCLKFVPQTTE